MAAGGEEAGHRALALIEQLRTASTSEVPGIIDQMEPLGRWSRPRLQEAFVREKEGTKSKLHTAMALLRVDPNSLLRQRLQREAISTTSARNLLLFGE